MDIKSFNMHSGRMVKEDGTVINIADALPLEQPTGAHDMYKVG